MPAMSKLATKLLEFVKCSGMKNRGALCVALVVTRHAKNKGLPLDPETLKTEKSRGQVLGLGKVAVQNILKDHQIVKILAEEGGRTSRGSLGNMQAYVEFLNNLSKDGPVDLDAVEGWWIARVKKMFAEKPLVLRLDPKLSLVSGVRDLLDQAIDRQKRDAGMQYLGAVLQHLVAAKLDLVLGHPIEDHGAFVADAPTERDGDFRLADVVIHVTTSPGEAVIRKCQRNLGAGLRPVIITLYDKVPAAVSLASVAKIEARIDVFDIEQFVASNIFELSGFASTARKVTVAELIRRYNTYAASENLSGLLIQEVQ